MEKLSSQPPRFSFSKNFMEIAISVGFGTFLNFVSFSVKALRHVCDGVIWPLAADLDHDLSDVGKNVGDEVFLKLK